MSEPYGNRSEAVRRLRVADSHWTEAVRTFQPYPERLRRLAAAAEEQRRAFLYAEVCGIAYNQPRDTGQHLSLGPELEPDARIGPAALWAKFDTAQKRWAKALGASDVVAIAQGFGDIAAAITQVADAISEHVDARGEPESQTG